MIQLSLKNRTSYKNIYSKTITINGIRFLFNVIKVENIYEITFIVEFNVNKNVKMIVKTDM